VNRDEPRLATLLRDLDIALRAAGLWDGAPPDPAAFESVEPFCLDTLSLPQWLQWVFIPRMRALIDAQAALPARCGTAAIAEMYFMGSEGDAVLRLIAVLREIDAAVEQAST
jgi:uncharacterized protein YqcC (DUF446 family)